MANAGTQKNRTPIATGFLLKGNIYFNLKFRFTNEFSVYNKLGKDLIGFAWFSPALTNEIFEIIWQRYMALKNHKNDYEFIAAGLLDSCKKFLALNSYFTVYLLAAIDFLLEGNIDRRVLTYENEIQKYSESNHLDKREFLHAFEACILERQAAVEKTLNQILGNANLDSGQSAMARLYKLEQDDDFFRRYWCSRFESYIGKVNESANKYANLTVLNTVDDMMRYELVQIILRNVEYKLCQNCGKLFVPSRRADSVYCDRIMPGQDKPCATVGAYLVLLEKRKAHPELLVYRRAYERLYKRLEMGYITQTDFADWDKRARDKRDVCHKGELAFEVFEMWIDETSRRRRKNEA